MDLVLGRQLGHRFLFLQNFEDNLTGNVLNYVQKILKIEKGHGKKVCVDQNTDLHPSGGNHDPWQEV